MKDEVARTDLTRAGTGHAVPSTMVTGYRYAEMGYTACFEPAMLPANARQAHLEMGDTPMVDKGAFVMLGSDDFFLRSLADKRDFERIKDYVAWTMHAAQAIAVKVVNPGGISAFKFNQRKLESRREACLLRHHAARDHSDASARAEGARRRRIRCTCMAATSASPATIETTLATIRAADGLPLHLTHIQFHSYGTEGDRHFSSGAARHRRAREQVPRTSRSTSARSCSGRRAPLRATACASTQRAKNADPKRTVIMDIECDAGCGVVPIRYRDKSYVNALQWAIGLETFLLVRGPLAHVPDDRSSERRAVLHLSAPDPAVDGPRLPQGDDAEDHPEAAAMSILPVDRRASTRSTRSPS